MKPADIRAMKIDEVRGKEKELSEELFNLKLRHATGQLENPLKIRFLRRDVARVKTILASMESDEGQGGSESNE